MQIIKEQQVPKAAPIAPHLLAKNILIIKLNIAIIAVEIDLNLYLFIACIILNPDLKELFIIIMKLNLIGNIKSVKILKKMEVYVENG